MTLDAAMTALMARDALRDRGATMTVDELYDCLLAATGNADAAEKAVRERIHAQLRAGQTPE